MGAVIPTPPTNEDNQMSDNQKNNNQIVNSGMDWITITSTDGDYTSRLLNRARFIHDTEQALDNISVPWYTQGYRGYRCGAMKFGVRNGDEAIVIISGAESQDYAKETWVEPSRITRLDIQVTVRLAVPDRDLAYREYVRLMKMKEEGTYKPSLRLIQSETGTTLYCGRRGKGKMLRLYDKSYDLNESELGTCWRYEVEYKGEVAKRAWGVIGGSEGSEVRVIGQVWGEFEARELRPRFSTATRITAIEVGRKVGDAKAKLEWLQRCVSPVVTQLTINGHADDVVDALSLRAIIKGVKNDGTK